MEKIQRPDYLKVKYDPKAMSEVVDLMKNLSLNTVCKEANCPNIGECYKKMTATFMILGSNCTRNCRFCNVKNATPDIVDEKEPEKIAEAVKKMGLKYVVVTSVTRDDLADEGASHFAKVITKLKQEIPSVKIEVLIPDMHAKAENLDIVLKANPDVLNHNMETIKRLYDSVRPQAEYERSIQVLRYAKENYPHILTKTGIMAGLGESEIEVLELMDDLINVKCDILTIGQYLRPSKEHIEIKEYVSLKQFERYKNIGMEKGFRYVASSPLVRSSYNAAEAFYN